MWENTAFILPWMCFKYLFAHLVLAWIHQGSTPLPLKKSRPTSWRARLLALCSQSKLSYTAAVATLVNVVIALSVPVSCHTLNAWGRRHSSVTRGLPALPVTRLLVWSLLMAEWIRKMWYRHTIEYYSALKMKEILSFATRWMKPEDVILSKISQS